MPKNLDEQAMVAKAFATLSDITSRIIVNKLENDNLSFTELQKSTRLDKNSLYYKIKKLIKSGIIVNYYQKREDTSEYSFYKITSFGKKILDQLDISVVKKRPIVTTDKKSEFYNFKEDINELYRFLPVSFDSYIKMNIKRASICDEIENKRKIKLLKDIRFFEDNWYEVNKFKTEYRKKMETI